MKKGLSVVLSFALTASFACTAFAGETEADAYSAEVVNIAIQPSAAFVPLYYAKESGWIEDALSEYGVEVVWNEFESGPPMNESLASGSSDIGVVGDVPIVSAVAAGQDNVLIALTCDAPLSYNLLVSPDSDIESVADLKGKKVATVVGSTAHNLVNKLLGTADLTMQDIELIYDALCTFMRKYYPTMEIYTSIAKSVGDVRSYHPAMIEQISGVISHTLMRYALSVEPYTDIVLAEILLGIAIHKSEQFEQICPACTLLFFYGRLRLIGGADGRPAVLLLVGILIFREALMGNRDQAVFQLFVFNWNKLVEFVTVFICDGVDLHDKAVNIFVVVCLARSYDGSGKYGKGCMRIIQHGMRIDNLNQKD